MQYFCSSLISNAIFTEQILCTLPMSSQAKIWLSNPVAAFIVFAMLCLLVINFYDLRLFHTSVEQREENLHQFLDRTSTPFKSGPSESSAEQKKYVGFHLNRGRLGNQLFHLFAGYGIGKILRRVHYLPFEEPRSNVECYLNYLKRIFPRLKETYILAKRGVKQKIVKFAKTGDSYVDPSRLNNLTDEYLLLNFVLGQNPRYFENYIMDIRNILQISDEIKQDGSGIIHSMKSHSESMCIHVRMTDFIQLGLHSNMNITIEAANALAKRRNISHFIIFGDDQHFMSKMSRRIIKDGGWKENAVFVSKYHESMDFYLSSLMCESFLISAAVSTFGWWLAFLAKNQNAVYYLNFTRPNVYVRKKEYFLKTWHLYSD